MTILTKVLIGAAVAGAGAAIIAGCSSAKEETKNEEPKVVDITEEIVKKEDTTILKKIKRFVKKKFVKFLAWVTLHMEQIEACGAVIGLAGSVISISTAVRDFARGNDINNKLDHIEEAIYKHDELSRDRSNHVGEYVQHVGGVLNKNVKAVDNDILSLATDMGYALPEREEEQVAG